MALSLSEIKKKKGSLALKQRSDLPKKVAIMPWQDMPKSEDQSTKENASRVDVDGPEAGNTGSKLEAVSGQDGHLIAGNLHTTNNNCEIDSQLEFQRPTQTPTETPTQTTTRKSCPTQTTTGTPTQTTTKDSRQKRDNFQTPTQTTTKRLQTPTQTTTKTTIQTPTQTTTDRRNSRQFPFSFYQANPTEIAVLKLFVSSCLENETLVTKAICRRSISETLGIKPKTFEMSVYRMRAKGWLQSPRPDDIKKGNGGYAVFRMYKEVYDEIYSHLFQTTTKRLQTTTQTTTGTTTQTTTTAPSSSRLNTNTNSLNSTTTDAGQIDAQPSAWDLINFDCLTAVNCPIGKKQIEQVKSLGVSPEALQESIYHFAYALESKWTPEEGRFKTSPLNYFMGCIRSNGLFEYDGYYQQKRKRAEVERAWLAKNTNNQDIIAAEARRGKAKYWLDSMNEEGRKRYDPYFICQGQEVAFGSAEHLEAVAQRFADEVEGHFQQNFRAAEPNFPEQTN